MNGVREVNYLNGTRKADAIKFLMMDVDGTLTDGKIYMGENGELMKAFNAKDGYAIRNLLPEYGITPVIITGRESKIIANRAQELRVPMLFQGIEDKITTLRDIASDKGIRFEEIAFIGDDLNDLLCIKTCGLSGCPADAADEVKICVDYVAGKNGGAGAVRDFVEWIIANRYA